MEAIEFLNTALEFLEQQPVREIDCRNAASRAYYCAFHTCKQLLEQCPPKESQRGAEHEKIIAELRKHQDKRFKILGNMLNTSRDQRVHADYRLDKKFALADAKKLLLSTKKLLQEIEKIQSDS
jgi:uncharacterized protein (UPF0332 family)